VAAALRHPPRSELQSRTHSTRFGRNRRAVYCARRAVANRLLTSALPLLSDGPTCRRSVAEGAETRLLLGAGPSAAAHPNAHRCALGTPGSPRVPLTRRWAGDPSRPSPADASLHPNAPLRAWDPGFGGRTASLQGGPQRSPARLRRGGISRPFRARFAPRANGAAPAKTGNASLPLSQIESIRPTRQRQPLALPAQADILAAEIRST
jgi:hypothetical protein